MTDSATFVTATFSWNVQKKTIKKGTLSLSDNVKHYIGEMYFFRAYAYFNLLKAYGDLPILTQV